MVRHQGQSLGALQQQGVCVLRNLFLPHLHSVYYSTGFLGPEWSCPSQNQRAGLGRAGVFVYTFVSSYRMSRQLVCSIPQLSLSSLSHTLAIDTYREEATEL